LLASQKHVAFYSQSHFLASLLLKRLLYSV